jgi:uncharacterized damage-inducible protein DinB
MQPDLIQILCDHNLWATRVLLDRSRPLTHEQFHRRFEIGPGSIHDTLRHIIGAMRRWADRIGARPLRESIERNGRPLAIDDLLALLSSADADLRSVTRELDASGRWSEPMEFVMPDGPTYHFSRAAALLHVLTHGMHHRAQILNMRRQLGLPPLGLDLDVVEWECVRTGQMSDA